MPRFLIERRLPNAGALSAADLQAISEKSNGVLADMRGAGKNIQWMHSYVTDNAIHCIYVADNPDDLLEHARCGGFPADNIMEVRSIIDPITAE